MDVRDADFLSGKYSAAENPVGCDTSKSVVLLYRTIPVHCAGACDAFLPVVLPRVHYFAACLCDRGMVFPKESE